MLTGERTLPGIPDENYWFRRHEAAYVALLPFVRGARVLEAGAGEGYGAELMSRTASSVTAIDYDDQTARHVAAKYPRIAVVRGDLQRLPFADGAFDVVANLQTIEHLHDQPGFVAECARVLRPAGTLLMTTPNRITFSPGRDTPLNPFHTRELSGAELVELLSPHFHVTRLWGVRHGKALRRTESVVGPLVDAQLARPPLDWSDPVRAAVHAVRARDFDVTPGDIDSSLDLVAVAWKKP